MPVFGVLLLCILICAIFGLINGIVIAYLNVPAFIGTLGMQLAVYGICLVYTNATPLGGYRKAYTAIATGKLFGQLPYMFIIAFVIGLIMWFVFNYTRHGKYMYAIGGNVEAAYLSGIRDKWILTSAHVICSGLAACASIVLTSRLASGQVNAGQGWDFEAIIGAIIGGVSITGGRGRVFGAVLGTFLVGMLVNGMTLNNIDSNVQKIVKGLVLIFAIAFDIYAVNKKNKR